MFQDQEVGVRPRCRLTPDAHDTRIWQSGGDARSDR